MSPRTRNIMCWMTTQRCILCCAWCQISLNGYVQPRARVLCGCPILLIGGHCCFFKNKVGCSLSSWMLYSSNDSRLQNHPKQRTAGSYSRSLRMLMDTRSSSNGGHDLIAVSANKMATLFPLGCPPSSAYITTLHYYIVASAGYPLSHWSAPCWVSPVRCSDCMLLIARPTTSICNWPSDVASPKTQSYSRRRCARVFMDTPSCLSEEDCKNNSAARNTRIRIGVTVVILFLLMVGGGADHSLEGCLDVLYLVLNARCPPNVF